MSDAETMTEERPAVEARGDQPATSTPTPKRAPHDLSGYLVAELPEAVRVSLAQTGLLARLRGVKDPKAAYREMLAGAVPGRAAAKPKPLDNRRKAVALAWADAEALAKGVKPKVGGKSNPDWIAIYENCEQKAAAASKEEIAEEHTKRAVRHHYVDLTLLG